MLWKVMENLSGSIKTDRAPWVKGENMIHVFVVGSKGIPAQYGGFETFVENLTAGKRRDDIMYHVSCMNNEEILILVFPFLLY